MFSIKEKVLAVVVVVLLVGFLGFIAYHRITVAFYTKEVKDRDATIVTLTEEKAALSSANLRLSYAIDQQNSKIKDLLAEADAAGRAASEALAKAQADSRKWADKYNKLWQSSRPTGDDCKDLSLRVDAYLDLRKKELAP